MDLHYKVVFFYLLVKSDLKLLNTLKSKILGSYSKDVDFTDIVLGSFNNLVRISGRIASVLRSNTDLLELLF
jgi:hypothetical protein